MIIGLLRHWQTRFRGPAWERAFRALQDVGPDWPEDSTPIGRDGIYLRVMSYATRSPEARDAVLESHRLMVDVQTTLSGSERIDWFPVESVKAKDAYDTAKDVQHYHRPGPASASVDVFPGTFVVLFPEDAHMPQLVTAKGDLRVKKAVVKVPLVLVSGQHS